MKAAGITGALAALVVLAACNGPSPAMWQSREVQVAMRGHSFNVFLKDGRAEAVRTNRVPVRRLGEVYLAGALAMEKASGCKVMDRTFRGDPAQMWARLDCGQARLNEVSCSLDRTHQDLLGDIVAVCDNVKGERTVVIFDPPGQSPLAR